MFIIHRIVNIAQRPGDVPAFDEKCTLCILQTMLTAGSVEVIQIICLFFWLLLLLIFARVIAMTPLKMNELKIWPLWRETNNKRPYEIHTTKKEKDRNEFTYREEKKQPKQIQTVYAEQIEFAKMKEKKKNETKQTDNTDNMKIDEKNSSENHLHISVPTKAIMWR